MIAESKPVRHRCPPAGDPAKRRTTSRSVLPVLLIGALCVLLAACSSQKGAVRGKQDRGITFPHAVHIEQGMGCTDCHSIEVPEAEEGTPASDVAVPLIPDHELCEMCHEITAEDETDKSVCDFCHSRPDQFVDAVIPILDSEKIFRHQPHVDRELECTVCHEDPSVARLPGGDLMAFCLNCHSQERPELEACSTCHETLDKTTRPQYRKGFRLAHDIPEIWPRVHGRESRIDPDYCAICHEPEVQCEECHRQNAPQSHTVSWRRRTHGLRAGWDRAACSVCHEEDFCLKCHQNTKPASHRGGWTQPGNGHCSSCHFPRGQNNCTVCHETIEHRSALRSWHGLGVYPSTCALCHPGGRPLLAPHPRNSSVGCTVCHQH